MPELPEIEALRRYLLREGLVGRSFVEVDAEWPGVEDTIDGMGGLSPIGLNWPQVEDNLRAGRSAVRVMPEWDIVPDLNTRLGAPLPEFELPSHYNRKRTRSMGRV
ncbi:MAG TPA: hypothetical protein EYQ82_07910, partial [Dehalococcoidia bacterium]|nr:hypothetical protein [Dehalococcoidia bacterium]